MTAPGKYPSDEASSARPVSPLRTAARILLGGALLFAGTSHLTFARQEFTAQVPEWMPLDADLVVLASGVVEIGLGAALVFLPRQRVRVGWLTAAFFVVIFPGNIAQYMDGVSAFGLNSDRARLIRLFVQPLLVLWAVWSTGAWRDRQSLFGALRYERKR